MEELVQKVAERAGISEEQARTAVETIADVLRERIPSPYNKYVDNFLKGEGMGSIFGGMIGRK
jgi:nucleoid DNA-binding protein